MNLDAVKTLAIIIATAVGALSGGYALYQNYRKGKATVLMEEAAAEAKAEAKSLHDKAAAIAGLEQALKAQESVIAGLTEGLKDCIERDNLKADQIEELRTADAVKTQKIAELTRKVAALEERNT